MQFWRYYYQYSPGRQASSARFPGGARAELPPVGTPRAEAHSARERTCTQVGRDGVTLSRLREATRYVSRPRWAGPAARVCKAGKLRGRPMQPPSPCLSLCSVRASPALGWLRMAWVAVSQAA